MLHTIYHTKSIKSLLLGLARIFDFGISIGNASRKAIVRKSPDDIISDAWGMVGSEMSAALRRFDGSHEIGEERNVAKQSSTKGAEFR